MPSQRDVAKRALVTLLLAMAVTYHVTLSNINRDSPDLAVLAAYRQVIKKAHPDRGGQVADAQMLTAAREKWDLANQRNGRPPKKRHDVYMLSETVSCIHNTVRSQALSAPSCCVACRQHSNRHTRRANA